MHELATVAAEAFVVLWFERRAAMVALCLRFVFGRSHLVALSSLGVDTLSWVVGGDLNQGRPRGNEEDKGQKDR